MLWGKIRTAALRFVPETQVGRPTDLQKSDGAIEIMRNIKSEYVSPYAKDRIWVYRAALHTDYKDGTLKSAQARVRGKSYTPLQVMEVNRALTSNPKDMCDCACETMFDLSTTLTMVGPLPGGTSRTNTP